MFGYLAVVIFIVDAVVGLIFKTGLPAIQQVHLANGGFNGSGIHLQATSLQLILDILILGAALARAVDLLSGIHQDADRGEQVLLLLAVGSGLDPGNDAQRDPAGKERDLRLQDGGKINGIHVHHAPFFFSYSDFKAVRVMGPTMLSTSSW